MFPFGQCKTELCSLWNSAQFEWNNLKQTFQLSGRQCIGAFHVQLNERVNLPCVCTKRLARSFLKTLDTSFLTCNLPVWLFHRKMSAGWNKVCSVNFAEKEQRKRFFFFFLSWRDSCAHACAGLVTQTQHTVAIVMDGSTKGSKTVFMPKLRGRGGEKKDRHGPALTRRGTLHFHKFQRGKAKTADWIPWEKKKERIWKVFPCFAPGVNLAWGKPWTQNQ